MRLRADACIARQVIDGLRTVGHDVSWIADWPADPGDDAILEFANQEARVIITRDKDFGTWAIQFGQLHQGILQVRGIPMSLQTQICLQALSAHEGELNQRAIVTVQPGRIRVRKC